MAAQRSLARAKRSVTPRSYSARSSAGRRCSPNLQLDDTTPERLRHDDSLLPFRGSCEDSKRTSDDHSPGLGGETPGLPPAVRPLGVMCTTQARPRITWVDEARAKVLNVGRT